jgi:hypothetical protein
VSGKRTDTNSSPTLDSSLTTHHPRRTHRPLLSIAANLIIYLILALWFPLVPHYGQAPPADIRTFAPSLAAGLLYGLLLLLLFVLHLWSCRELGRQAKPARLRTLLIVALLYSLPLLLTYPMNATDVYRYVIRGRISSVYGESPYVTPPDSFARDPLLPLAGEWAGETSPYGPLWEGVAAGLTAISGDNLLFGILLFKTFGMVCFLGATVLLWLLLPSYRKPSYTALWAWNPFLLLTFVANAHNDALMLLWLLLGLWLMRRGQPAMGFLVMALAPLTKLVALLALPFFFLAAWKALPGGRQRARFTLLSTGGTLALTLIAFVPWTVGPATGSFLSSTLGLVTRLAREAGAGASFSPATLLWFGGQLLPGKPLSLTTIGLAARLLFASFFLLLLWQTWKGRPAERGTAEIFIAYLLQALNFRIWYAAWPFPWLLLDGKERPYWLHVGLWFLLTSQLSVIIYGHIRVYLLGGQQAYSHLIGIPFTFLIPLFLARFPSTMVDLKTNNNV